MKTRALLLLGILIALGFTISSAQSNFSISGTVFAASGSSLQNTAVIACLFENDTCDNAGSKLMQFDSSASSLKYQIAGLASKNYLMLAWRDLNSNQEVDAGDELGVSQSKGKPILVKAPAENVELRLTKFTGDFDAFLAQANRATTQPATQPTVGLAFSGVVRPVSGSSLQNTAVLAAVFENGTYNQTKSQAVLLDSNGGFQITKLEARPYVLIAWRDLDGNKDISAADELAPYRFVGTLALATPPLANIVLQLEQGDSSLDALVALTVNATTPSTPNASSNPPAATNTQGIMTEIDCGNKNAFYGDYGCIIPPSDAYLGNSRCPTTASFPGVKQEKGFFTGYVYDACNRPIAGAKVNLSQSGGGTRATTTTDNKSFYRLESQYVVGAYVYAEMPLKDAGNDYTMTLYPQDRIYGLDGGIQNMHYTMRDSQLWFWKYFSGFDVPQNPVLEFTLEPVKFFDGTTPRGKQVFLYQAEGGRIKFNGVKYGVYKISVQLITPSGRIKTWLQSQNSDQTFETMQFTLIGTKVLDLQIKLAP